MQQEILKTYNIREVSEKEGISRYEVVKSINKFIPVKILTAQSRATQRGYTVRYIIKKEFEDYIEKIKQKPKNNDYKYKKDLKN